MLSVGGDERVIEMDAGDGCLTMYQMYLLPLSCMCKSAKMVNFMLGIFYHN